MRKHPLIILLLLFLYNLVVLQNLTSLQFGVLLQVIQLHDGFDRSTTMLGNRIERLTLLHLVEAGFLSIVGSRCCCCQFNIFALCLDVAAANTAQTGSNCRLTLM